MTSKSLNLSTIGIRKFFLCLVTLLLPLGTWAEDYDITVAGVQVTSDNATSGITGDNITGTVTFDVTSNTLTLDGATIEGSIVSSLAGNLTVYLIGTNTVNSGSVAAFLQTNAAVMRSLAFTAAEGAILLTDNPRTDGDAIIYSGFSEPTVPEGYVFSWDADGHCNLGEYYDLSLYTFVNGNSYFSPYYVTSANCNRLMGKYIETCDSWDNSTITVSYDDSKKTLTLNNASPESAAPYGTTYFIECNGGKAKNITVMLLGENQLRQHPQEGGAGFIRNNSYEGQITITTDPDNPGSLEMPDIDSYYGEDYVLNAQTPIIYQNGLRYSVDDDGIRHIMYHTPEEYGLSIGDLVVTSANADAIHLADTEFISVGDDGYVTFDVETSTLMLNNAELKHGIISGLENLTIRFMGTNKVNTDSQVNWLSTQEAAQQNAVSTLLDVASLTFECDDEGTLQLCGKANTYSAIAGFKSVSYGSDNFPCYLHSSIPSNYDTSEKLLVDVDGGGPNANVTLSSVVAYPLWIGNGTSIQVTVNNQESITYNYNIEGKVSFDPETNTLAMNEATISCKIYSGIGNLTIDVLGDCGILSGDTGSVVRSFNAGKLTIHKVEDLSSLRIESFEYGSRMPIIQGFTSFDYSDFNMVTSTPAMYGEYVLYEYDDEVVSIYGLYNPEETNGYDKGIISALFSTTQYFPLWVAGVQVNNENLENIMSDLVTGEGTISFDPESNTLLLSGAVLIGDGGVAWGSDEDLTIRFLGQDNRIASANSSAVYCTEGHRCNLYFEEDSEDETCELYMQTPVETNIIGKGFTKAYRESSRLVDYNMTVSVANEAGEGAEEWHVLGVTTTFTQPVVYLDETSESPQAVVAMSYDKEGTPELTYNDLTIYVTTDGEEYFEYTKPVAVSPQSPLVYAYAQIRNVYSETVCGKYIGYGVLPKTMNIDNTLTPQLTEIGDGDGMSFDPTKVVYSSTDNGVATFVDGVITAVGEGTVTLTANLQEAIDMSPDGYAEFTIYPLVENDGILSFPMTVVDPSERYKLWVKGTQVTERNKDNVLGDKNATMRYNPVTNTLLLYGANVTVVDSTSFVRCAMTEGLTIELRGTNTLAFISGFRNMLDTNVPLSFITNSNNPGQMSWEVLDPVQGFFADGLSITYTDPLELQTSGKLISVTPPVDYGLMVGTTVVTSVNCTDILGDGTVKYTDEDKTLVLTDATLTVPVFSGLSQLKIYLQGSSTISGTENMLTSSVADAPLTFTTSLSDPGMLTLTKTKGTWISGFASPAYDNPLASKEEGDDLVILDMASIAPIVNEDNPSVEVPVADPTDPDNPDDPIENEVIGDVIYNLPPHSYDEGSGTEEDPAGAVLDQVVAQNATFFENNEPGSDDFAAGFTGLVFMLAPGTGDIQIDANILEGNKLAVQIGLSDPVLLPNESNPTVGEMTTYYVPFAVSERTYVYVYLAETPSPSLARSQVNPNHEKVLHGHVKVSQLSVSSSSMVNSNVYSEQNNNVGRQVKLYSLPKSAVADGGNGVVLSTVALADVATSRAISREAAPEEFPITELAPTVFDGLDKSKVLYIDLKGTALEDFTVNRTKGIMSGFGSNTLIYLPKRNDDGGEPNVVINNECARLTLNSDSKFRSPAEFTAAEASLNRTFTIGRTSTVFLPFALTKAQADALGLFYKFQEIDGDDAVFYPAEADGIEANKPYIFTPATEKVIATDVSVVKVNSFSATQGNLIGTYEQIEWVVDPGNIYGFAAADDGGIVGGQFVRAAAGAWIPPFRAYLQVDAAPSRLNIVIGEQETDDIREIPVCREDAATAYDLQGRKISNLQPPTSNLKSGLYIINGKKVVVK